MDDRLFDRLTRRFVVGSLTAVLGLGAVYRPDRADARKRKRRVKRNAFGCVDVGGFCKNAGQCCSDICRGKKGKKTCRAHNADVCQAGDQDAPCSLAGPQVACTTSAGLPGQCQTTTGNAGFCNTSSSSCFSCTKDAECGAVCGAGAACLKCPSCVEGTRCSSPDECVAP